MKPRLLILILCLIIFSACDKTPKTQDAAAQDKALSEIDKNFNAAMLPLDNYFAQNAGPYELQNFQNLKNNYKTELKNALGQTDPAAREAALYAADDKYTPRINALQNQVKQKAVNSYIADLENKNAASRAAAAKILGPRAAAEIKTAQDKMVNEIKSALNSPDPQAAVQRVENAGNNFQNAILNTVNKYASAQNTPPAQAAKIFEPYNSAGVSLPRETPPAGTDAYAPARQISGRPVVQNYGAPQYAAAPRPAAANPAAPGADRGFSGGANTASLSGGSSGAAPEFLNNYTSLPQGTSDAGGLAGQDFLSKVQNDIKTVRDANQPPPPAAGAGPGATTAAAPASGRPQTNGAATAQPGGSGGGPGRTVAYLPPDKIAEISAGFDNEVKENYSKWEKTYGKEAAEKYKQTAEKYKNIFEKQGPVPRTPEEKQREMQNIITDYIKENSDNFIKADYNYRAPLINEAFKQLRDAAPNYNIAPLQNEYNARLAKTASAQREIIFDADGKITGKPGAVITPAEQYQNEINQLNADMAARLDPVFKELQISQGPQKQ